MTRRKEMVRTHTFGIRQLALGIVIAVLAIVTALGHASAEQQNEDWGAKQDFQ